MIIGLCGGSGAGKSTLIEILKIQFPNQIEVIDMDNYYISRDELSFEERRHVNYDVPESLDFTMLRYHMEALQRGEAIEQPQFTFQTYERKKETVRTSPKPVIIVDGIFSFYDEQLRSLYDLKIFLDVPREVRLQRRMKRNMARYGRTREFETEQFLEKVNPMHERYVEPCRQYADMILPFENSDYVQEGEEHFALCLKEAADRELKRLIETIKKSEN